MAKSSKIGEEHHQTKEWASVMRTGCEWRRWNMICDAGNHDESCKTEHWAKEMSLPVA